MILQWMIVIIFLGLAIALFYCMSEEDKEEGE